jgi:hypothetical protein
MQVSSVHLMNPEAPSLFAISTIDDAVNAAIIKESSALNHSRQPASKDFANMPGPRKVRVFRDNKKSPNWYVEWRDLAGRRHCESCGPDEVDAQERARHIRAELRRNWVVTTSQSPHGETKVIQGQRSLMGAGIESEVPSSTLRVHALLKCPQFDVPVDLHIEVNSELIDALSQLLPK